MVRIVRCGWIFVSIGRIIFMVLVNLVRLIKCIMVIGIISG